MMDPDRAMVILRELTEAGFSIAIDDFGTGYSSLSRLATCRSGPEDRPVLRLERAGGSSGGLDRLRVPRARLGAGPDALAEGIETPEELAFLRERGCKLGQGYYFSKPVPPEEIIAYAFGGIPTAARAWVT